MAFIPSIGATHLLPLPPTAPGPVNTSTIYGEVGSWTLAAGEYLYGVELTSLFQSRPDSVSNHGSIFLDYGNEFGGGTRLSSGVDEVENTGIVVARGLPGVSGHGFNHADIFGDVRTLDNSGQLFALSANGFASVVKSYSSPTVIVNSGLMAAYAREQGATAIFLPNGGSVVNMATGHMLAEGFDACAVLLSAPKVEEGHDLENAGRIEAASVDGGNPACGVRLEAGGSILNSGLIRADIAVEMNGTLINSGTIEGEVALQSSSSVHLTNEADGIVKGDILGGSRNDLIENHGTITGNALLGAGNDSFLNIGGRISGIVDLGLGDDEYTGSARTDRVAGDSGKDHIEGGGGGDLLMGGNDADTLIGGTGNDGLYGERGDDVIVTSGGDHAFGGRDDDRVELGDFSFAFAGGGGGNDTLVLAAGVRALDLSSAITTGRIEGFETLEMTGSQELTVRAGDVAALTDTGGVLRIDATGDDAIALVGAWKAEGSTEVGGARYHRYTLGGEAVLVQDGAETRVVSGAPANASGLDPVADGAAALVPGLASGLGYTPDDLFVSGFEIYGTMTIYEGETWYTVGKVPAVYTFRDSTMLLNEGLLLAINEDQATAIAAEFYNQSRITNDGTIRAYSTGAVENPTRPDFPSIREGGYAVRNALEVTNRGTIEAFSLHGVASAMGDLRIYPAMPEARVPTAYEVWGGVPILHNEGRITAVAESNFAFGVIGSVELENKGEIRVSGGRGAIAIYSNANVANDGVIEATADGESIAILFSPGGSLFTLTNSGRISAEVAIRVNFDPYYDTQSLRVVNDGVIEGLVEASRVGDRIVNNGLMAGDVRLGVGNDVFDGSQGAQRRTIFGERGNDQITGGTANDRLAGGLGDDRLDGGAGAVDFASYEDMTVGVRVSLARRGAQDTVGAGVDTLIGIEALAGSLFDDFLSGNAGTNRLIGHDGDDMLNGGDGADFLAGGDGDDVYFVDDAGDKVSESGSGGIDRVNSSISFTLGSRIENLVLSGAGSLSGTGNNLANSIVGNGAANLLDGGGAADLMKGGDGDDIYIVDRAGDRAVEMSATGGFDTVRSLSSFTLGAHIESLVLDGAAASRGTGNALANRITGNAAANILDGAGGADLMRGGAGDDLYRVDNRLDRVVESAGEGVDTVHASISHVLADAVDNLRLVGNGALNGVGNALDNAITGNAAANLLRGGDGDDLLRGGLGDDRLFGGAGDDQLSGGGGADRFYFDASAGDGVDALADFSARDDRIFLDRDVFSGLASNGTLTAGGFRLGTEAQDADDRIVYDRASGDIFYDPDGAGGADAVLFATVREGLGVTHLDFVGYGG